jgi:hypothetical protein
VTFEKYEKGLRRSSGAAPVARRKHEGPVRRGY